MSKETCKAILPYALKFANAVKQIANHNPDYDTEITTIQAECEAALSKILYYRANGMAQKKGE